MVGQGMAGLPDFRKLGMATTLVHRSKLRRRGRHRHDELLAVNRVVYRGRRVLKTVRWSWKLFDSGLVMGTYENRTPGDSTLEHHLHAKKERIDKVRSSAPGPWRLGLLKTSPVRQFSSQRAVMTVGSAATFRKVTPRRTVSQLPASSQNTHGDDGEKTYSSQPPEPPPRVYYWFSRRLLYFCLRWHPPSRRQAEPIGPRGMRCAPRNIASHVGSLLIRTLKALPCRPG